MHDLYSPGVLRNGATNCNVSHPEDKTLSSARHYCPTFRTRSGLAVLVALASFTYGVAGSESKKVYSGAGCAAAADSFFTNEVWIKVGAQSCLKCHKLGGEAEDDGSEFVLQDPERSLGAARDEVLRHNRDAFAQMARRKEGDQSRLLLKATGKLKHGGKEALKLESTGYRVLADFVTRLHVPPSAAALARAMAEDKNAPPFFDGIVMLDDQKLLRRVTLSLAGRLPTDSELAVVARQGRKAFPMLLDALMKEDAFYERLREGFNDIFLTVGYDDVPENALSYEHFSTTRGWTEKYDLSKIADEKARLQAKYKLSGDYRKAMLGEPMKLIEYIVRNDRPFSEIVTADYIMVTPFTSRGYGVYEELKPKFKNPEDPFEYIPVKLKKLVGRNRDEDEDSPTGFYAHAGLLSNFQYLKRYPTTETNRNRQRARVYFLQFLGIDVLELAARVTDAAAVSAKYEIPTMQATECVVCHKTIDPVAGLFQDYWKFEGVYGQRKGGWFKDMFGPGYEGEDLPPAERWRALQWLGERTVKDPRFAVAMVEHVNYILTGRKVLLPPKDLEDPLFSPKLRAYQEQRKQIEAIALRFSKNGFNLKSVFKDMIDSDFYRADGLASVAAGKSPARRVELDDVGLIRMLAPEQVERKVAAIFGQPWGKLNDQMAMLYGGIDSKEVTERATDPSGAMGAIQRILANDVACKQTSLDFSRQPADRKLFPEIEPNVLPGASPEADAKIRKTIAHLHQRVLGRTDAPDSPEVQRTYELFAGIVADAAASKNVSKEENWTCRQGLIAPVPDPKYTVRAWRAVLTYLLRRPEFLYE